VAGASEEGTDGPLLIVNMVTGAATIVSTLTEPGGYVTGMTSNNAGVLLVTVGGEGGSFFATIDPSDGMTSFISVLPDRAAGISFRPAQAAATSFTLKTLTNFLILRRDPSPQSITVQPGTRMRSVSSSTALTEAKSRSDRTSATTNSCKCSGGFVVA
jgi:hypothetical protein